MSDLPLIVFYPSFRSSKKSPEYTLFNTDTCTAELFDGDLLKLMETHPEAEKRTWDWCQEYKRQKGRHYDYRNPYLIEEIGE